MFALVIALAEGCFLGLWVSRLLFRGWGYLLSILPASMHLASMVWIARGENRLGGYPPLTLMFASIFLQLWMEKRNGGDFRKRAKRAASGLLTGVQASAFRRDCEAAS